MIENGSKKMIITVDTESGRIESVVDENGKEAQPVDPGQIDEIYFSKQGFRYVSTVLHAHASPGCVYIKIGGKHFRICTP